MNLDARRRGAALDLLDRYRIALTSSAQTAIPNSIFIPVCHCDKFQSETYAMRAHFIASRKIFVLYLFRNRNLLFRVSFYLTLLIFMRVCVVIYVSYKIQYMEKDNRYICKTFKIIPIALQILGVISVG